MAGLNLVSVMISIATLDKELANKMEPRTSIPERRLRIIEELAKNGVPAGVNIAPVIPGLTDKEIPLDIKKGRGIRREIAGYILLRLPYSVKDLFSDWLKK